MQRVLILEFDIEARIATCFNREIHELLRVKLEGNTEPQKGQFLRFESLRNSDISGVLTLESDHFVIQNPEANDCVRLWKNADGQNCVTIWSWIGFSGDSSHSTYERKVGFTDWYGLVDCMKYFANLETPGLGLYTSAIAVKDLEYVKNGGTLFEVADKPRLLEKENAETGKFFEKMNKFQDKSHESKMNDSKISAIALSVNESTNTIVCFSEQFVSKIVVKLPLDVEVKQGQRIIFVDDECQNDVFIPNPKPDSIEIKEDESIQFENNAIMIDTIAAVSPLDTDSTNMMELAYARLYGHVSVEAIGMMEKGFAYNVQLTIGCLEGPSPLFKIIKVGERLPEKESEAFLEELLKAAQQKERESNGNENENHESLTLKTIGGTDSSAQSESSISDYRASETSSKESGLQESIPPKKKSFGRMPSKGVEKKDVENCVLILSIDECILIGYETSLLELMKVDIENLDLTLSKWGTLRFISNGNENGRTVIKKGTARYSDPNDVIFAPDEPPKIISFVMFSSNPKHQSYNKLVAFSDRFGLVKIPETDELFEEMTIYRAMITIDQCQDPLSPVFKAVSNLERQPKTDQDDKLIEAMKPFEERLFVRLRENGLSSSEIPRESPTERRQPHFSGNQKTKQKFKPNRATLNGYFHGLVIDTKQKNGRNLGRVWTTLGDAVFVTQPTLDKSGELINPGDFIQAKLERVENQLLITKIVEKDEFGETKAKIGSDGTVTVRGVLLLKRAAEKDDIRFYNHASLKWVQAESDVYYGENEMKKVDVEFIRMHRPTKVPNQPDELCYWFARKLVTPSNDSQKHSSPRPQLINEYEKKENGEFSKNDRGFSRGTYSEFPQQGSINRGKINHVPANMNQPSRNYPMHTNSYMPRQQESTSDFDNNYDEHSYENEHLKTHYITNSSSCQQILPVQTYFNGNGSAIPNHNCPAPIEMGSRSVSSVPEGKIFRSVALMTRRFSHKMIAYLESNQKAAIIYWKVVEGPTVRHGGSYQVEYTPIDISEDTCYAPFQVTKVLAPVNVYRELNVGNDECYRLFRVNLCNQEECFNDYVYRTGYSVLTTNNEDVPFVLMDDKVQNPQKKVVSSSEILDTYRGKNASADMVGWCRFEWTRVPRMMVDFNYNGDEEVTEFVWKLVYVEKSYETYLIKQKGLKTDNLGEDYQRVEHDDDISRQKKHAHLMDRMQNPGLHSSASSTVGNSYQGPLSSNRYEDQSSHYGTPQASVNNGRAGTSQSFHSAYGSQHQGPSFSTQNPINSYHNNPEFNQTVSFGQNRASSGNDNEKYARLLGSLSSQLSNFMKDDGLRMRLKQISLPGYEALEKSLTQSQQAVSEYFGDSL